MTDKVFVYWDNSNIFYEARRLAEERNGGGANARYRVRIHFDNLLRLAHADRTLAKAVAAGSVPPEMRHLWTRMENMGVEVKLFDRGDKGRGEQNIPDQTLQLDMLKDALRNNGSPGIAVLLTGDGAGYDSGEGFHATLEMMHERGWRVEILSWAHSCKRRMREWAEENGVFVALDDYYDSITFLEPSSPGQELAKPRDAAPLDMSSRPIAAK
ncbi:MAG: NYN domain-containing protein [Gammaproteobacteria bacterium]